MASGIKIEFKGFDDMIDRLKKAGVDAKPVVDKAVKNAANIQLEHLRHEMIATGVAADLVGRADASVEWDGERCKAYVGYKKGAYDPQNPSDGYKAIFINYGTPRIKPREYLEPAMKSAQKAITRETKKALNQILEEVGG